MAGYDIRFGLLHSRSRLGRCIRLISRFVIRPARCLLGQSGLISIARFFDGIIVSILSPGLGLFYRLPELLTVPSNNLTGSCSS
jgi:hypothetical protein